MWQTLFSKKWSPETTKKRGGNWKAIWVGLNLNFYKMKIHIKKDKVEKDQKEKVTKRVGINGIKGQHFK